MAWSGSPTATRLPPPPASSSSSSTCAGSVSWYSSTNSHRARSRSWRSSSGSPSSSAIAARTSSAGSEPDAAPRPAPRSARVVARRAAPPRRGEGGDSLVLLLEGGGEHPVLAAELPAPGGQLRRPDPTLGGPHQQVTQLGAETRGPDRRGQGRRPANRALLLDVTAEQLGHDGVLLGRGEQPGRGVAAQQCRPAEDAVGVGVERPRQGLTDGPGDPAGDPGAQLGGGLAAEGQDEDLLGIHSGVDPGGHGIDDRRRLAGAGTGQAEQRAGR